MSKPQNDLFTDVPYGSKLAALPHQAAVDHPTEDGRPFVPDALLQREVGPRGFMLERDDPEPALHSFRLLISTEN